MWSVCPYEAEGYCRRLNTGCRPNRLGCIIRTVSERWLAARGVDAPPWISGSERPRRSDSDAAPNNGRKNKRPKGRTDHN